MIKYILKYLNCMKKGVLFISEFVLSCTIVSVYVCMYLFTFLLESMHAKYSYNFLPINTYKMKIFKVTSLSQTQNICYL